MYIGLRADSICGTYVFLGLLVQNGLDHVVLGAVVVEIVITALIALLILLVAFFLFFGAPATFGNGLENCHVGSEDIGGEEREPRMGVRINFWASRWGRGLLTCVSGHGCSGSSGVERHRR